MALTNSNNADECAFHYNTSKRRIALFARFYGSTLTWGELLSDELPGYRRVWRGVLNVSSVSPAVNGP